MRHLLGWPMFFVVATAAQLGNVASRIDAEPHGYLFADSGVYALAAESLFRDGDLDLLNQLFRDGRTLTEALPELQDPGGGEFALSKNGQLTIKQSPVLSVAAIPFYAVFGLIGFLLFNLAVLNLLLFGLVKLAGDGPAARVVVLIGFLSTPLWRYSFNYSPDLTLCGLIVGALFAARNRRPLFAGLCCGLAVSLKLYAAALLLPIPMLAWIAAGRRWSAPAWVVAGGVIGLAPGLAFNAWQFGSPHISGYERQLKVIGTDIGLADHTSRFRTPPLEGFRDLLFDTTLGLWPTAPLWFAWPLAAVLLLRWSEGRTWVLAAIAIIVLDLALFSRYSGALEGSKFANRYLFPALVLGFALIAAAVRDWFKSPSPEGTSGRT